MAPAQQTGVVRGYRAIRALLGVRMATVYALARFDTGREPRVLVRSGEDGRGTVRTTVADVWQLYRDWQAEQQAGADPQG